jgi:Tfp pilus assembly protein PilN
MRAVNLIPVGSRSGRVSISASPQTLALVVALAAALIAGLLYVSAANTVTARRSELAQVSASAAAARTVANSLAPYVTISKQRASQLAVIRQLATSRFPWSHLLDQFAALMPADAAISSLQGATGAPGTAAPTAGPTVQLSGCATSHLVVARTMDQLRGVDGVTAVTLTSSNESGAGAASPGSASSGSAPTAGGGCVYPVQFQLSLTLGNVSSSAPAAGATTPR